MTPTHGTVIVCRRINGDTHAWEELDLSEMVPEGYFVEIWPVAGKTLCHAGMMDRPTGNGYIFEVDERGQPTWWREWWDAGEAVRWCWQDRKRRERERKAAA